MLAVDRARPDKYIWRLLQRALGRAKVLRFVPHH
jgi:hypothetical protein